MKRVLAFGLLGPVVSWITFCMCMLVSTLLKNPDAGHRAWGQFIRITVGDISLGRVVATLPAIALALVAMLLATRATKASSFARGAPWKLAAVVLLSAPELLLATFVLAEGAPTILAGLASGVLTLMVCDLIAGAPADQPTAAPSAHPPGPSTVRRQFGLRQD